MGILEAAKEWGVPPWVIEEQATEEWWERWRVMREETIAYQKHQHDAKSFDHTGAIDAGL